jgi:2,4-dienoyl-CoA reductase-like NADH-dependent reductase (Old Yellow Enzyme family)
MSGLFDSLTLRGVTLRNRIGMSPMCTYSCDDGRPSDWHLVHLGSRAVGGAGLVMTEATSIERIGRISPADAGLWEDGQIPFWVPIARILRECGAVAGMQIAHAGRKAGTRPPWQGRAIVPDDEGGWQPVAPSPLPFQNAYRTPRELAADELPALAQRWADAARRAHAAGFECLEIHMAHGYLLHQFLSPLTNHRGDLYGGSIENRMRFPLSVAEAIRAAWPRDLPLLARISATDWVPGGWDPEQAVVFCNELRHVGMDLIDCSSGGTVPEQVIPYGPGYQVPFAERIRREAGLPTAAVGMITEPLQAEEIIRAGQADLILLGRELLRDPYWPLRAAAEFGVNVPWPRQYDWAVG